MSEKFQISNFKFQINLWLILICLFFLGTRLYQIDSNPPSLYWDEASIGYNAYSILKTGHDEWGKAFPIHFRAFGEFKLPVYIYSVVVTEALFGLTPLAIRLPAVLYSLGSLILVYFLVKKITTQKSAGLFVAFSFAISPWMFIFSRTGYEVTAGLLFFLLAIYFFLLSQRKKFFLLFSVLSLVLSIYSYNSFRLLSGLTILVALSYTLWTNHTKKTILICVVIVVLFSLSLVPILRLLLFDGGFSRTSTFALLPNVQQVYDLQGKPHFQIIFDRTHGNDWTGNIVKIGQNYISHFSPQFLFGGDLNPRSQQPGFGQLYLIDLPLIFLGFYTLFKLRKLYLGLVIFLLLISPIPASLFKEAPHSLRAILMTPVIVILTGLGIWWLVSKKKLLAAPTVILYLSFFGYYFFSFLTVYPQKTSADWQYGYQAIYTQYADKFSNYNNIIISDEYAQPYIFPLVYLKIDPANFQKKSVKNPVNDWGFSTINHFDNFYFVKENSPDLNYPGKSLVFVTKPLAGKLPNTQINFLNGNPALFVYEMIK